MGTTFFLRWQRCSQVCGESCTILNILQTTDFYTLFFFLNRRIPGIWQFPGQGLNPAYSHDLHTCSCGLCRSQWILRPTEQGQGSTLSLHSNPSRTSQILNLLRHSRNSIVHFFFFLSTPAAGGGSQARNQTQALVATCATAVAMP